MASATFSIPGEPGVTITITENAGNLEFSVSIVPGPNGEIGDIRGVFFNVADPSVLGGLHVTGANVTDSQFSNDNVSNLGNGANINPNVFDAGVELGTPGISKDDIQTTHFTLSGAAPLSLSLLNNVEFGARITSTGAADGPREGSEKITGTICFYPGTRIATPSGERAVETLAIGDRVIDSSGNVVPIRWIGRQTISTVFADPLRVLPICVTAGALDDNLPVRDLLVSPDHALLVDDVLIHAGALVNGTTVRRYSEVPEIFTYFHIELANQALVVAEGVPAETFVDNVDRKAFDNWEEHERLIGDAAPVVELALPRAKSYRQVPMSTRRRLALRAAELLGQVG
jgi:hypothetical protein